MKITAILALVALAACSGNIVDDAAAEVSREYAAHPMHGASFVVPPY